MHTFYFSREDLALLICGAASEALELEDDDYEVNIDWHDDGSVEISLTPVDMQAEELN